MEDVAFSHKSPEESGYADTDRHGNPVYHVFIVDGKVSGYLSKDKSGQMGFGHLGNLVPLPKLVTYRPLTFREWVKNLGKHIRSKDGDTILIVSGVMKDADGSAMILVDCWKHSSTVMEEGWSIVGGYACQREVKDSDA